MFILGYSQEHNVYIQINLQQSPYKASSPITHNFPKNLSQDQYKDKEPHQKVKLIKYNYHSLLNNLFQKKKRKYKHSKCKNNCIVVLDGDDED